jgi:5-hydroxyisourate hydrolase-like protein (transthyretin family)
LALLRPLRVLTLTVTLLAASLAATVPAAQAVTNSGCSGFSGATSLGNSYHDGFVNVTACGPRPLYGGSRANVYAYPGALPNPGYQCAEFAARFLYVRFGLTMYISTNGDQVVDHYVAKYPKLFVAVANGTLNQAPVQGDVISYSQSSNFHASSGGHTGVVQSSSVDVNGDGTVTTIEENWSSTGVHVIPVSNWRLVLGGFPYIKWMHAPSLSNGPLDASNIQTVSGSGMYTNLPIRHLWSITNGSTSPVSVASVLLGVRDPAGKTSSEPCASGVTLGAGETIFCTGASTWTLAGTYQVWPQWQDGKGNWYSGQLGQVTTFTLTSGRVPDVPASVAAVVNDGGVQVQWSPPVSTGGPALTGYVVTTVPATARLVLPPTVSSLNLAGLQPSVTYTVQVRAANSIGLSASNTTVLEGSILSLRPTTTTPNYNDSVTLAGSLVSASGAPRVAAPINVQSSNDGGDTWTDVTTLTTDDSGDYSYAATPLVNTTYRVGWAGTDSLRPASSKAVALVVKPIVTLSLLHSSSKKQRPVFFSGKYTPASADVALQVQRKVAGKWATLATVTTDASGSYAGKWVPRQAGTYYLRVVRPATSSLGAGVTLVRQVVIVK